MLVIARVCVYCGSRPGNGDGFLALARGFGARLAARGQELVYGGGNVGLMGAVADGVLDAGGKVRGVIPRSMVEREVAHRGVTELHVVGNMHERKALMEQLADAFVALPGGIGTLDELFEIWTWATLGYHAKPLGLLDLDGYWRPLVALLDQMVAAGFLRQAQRDMLLVDDDGDRLLERLGASPQSVTRSPAASEEDATSDTGPRQL